MSLDVLVATEPLRLARGRRSLGMVAGRYVRRWPLGVAALLFICVLVVLAVLAHYIAPYDPLQLHRVDRLHGPSSRYWLGTDPSGRDQLSRIIFGTRVSLYVGIVPILISSVVGTTLGSISGFLGGTVDALLQRVLDALVAIPALVIALTIVALLGHTTTNVVLAIAVVTVPTINRVARAATLQIMGLPYVLAAQSLGASNARLLLRHIIPNSLTPVIVLAASLVGTAILAEAGLSFLGLGIPPPQPTWGNMLSGVNRTVYSIAPWLVIFPGIAITITVLAFNLLGDTVRDIFDPRLRNRGA